MKKGFTLIELLAVIVILAIIALIATPIILGIIEDARKGSIEASANGYIDAVEYDSASLELKGTDAKDGVYEVSKLDVKIDGEKPTSGVVTLDSGKVTSATLIINNQTVYYDGKVSKVIDDKTNNYKEELLNGADPVLKDELVPVIISNDGIVVKSSSKINWYSYEDKRWANAVILFDEDNYKIGEVIPEDAIKEYYVWVPKYAYRLWNVNSDNTENIGKPIEIVFGDKAKTTGENNGDMYLHPAFTNFDTNGIWVGKFELSYNEETFTDSTKFLSVNPNTAIATESSNIIIKQNVRSLTSKTIGEFHTLIYNSHRNLDSHMITNMEWGAAAYLTYSVYGRCDKDSCTEVMNNNSNTGRYQDSASFEGQWTIATITGCAANSNQETWVKNQTSCENKYNTKKGYLASTTGNITGIYDMAGGGSEFTMAFQKNSDGKYLVGTHSYYNTGFNGILGAPGSQNTDANITEITNGMELPNRKYYNLYNTKYGLYSSKYFDYSEGLLGDATKEVANSSNDYNKSSEGLWFNDESKFISNMWPFFTRGNDWSVVGERSGIFAFQGAHGGSWIVFSTRSVLAF